MEGCHPPSRELMRLLKRQGSVFRGGKLRALSFHPRPTAGSLIMEARQVRRGRNRSKCLHGRPVRPASLKRQVHVPLPKPPACAFELDAGDFCSTVDSSSFPSRYLLVISCSRLLENHIVINVARHVFSIFTRERRRLYLFGSWMLRPNHLICAVHRFPPTFFSPVHFFEEVRVCRCGVYQPA